MTTQEIAARLLHPDFPVTPERLAKAKAACVRSRRPSAFVELIQALPGVSEQMIEQAHTIRLQHLDIALQAARSRAIGKTDLRGLAEQQRMIEDLTAAQVAENASHQQWKESIDAEHQTQTTSTTDTESPPATGA